MELCRDIPYSVATKYGKVITQVSCDKCLYVEIKFQHRISIATKKTLSQHKIQSSQKRATRLCRDKEVFCRDKQNMRVRRTLSRQRNIFCDKKLK